MGYGAMVISLDFELLWGVFDKVDHKEKELYFQNTRKIIPDILEIFSSYNIHCTWATVGMLLNKNWEEWNTNFPHELPGYINPKLSAFSYGNNNESMVNEILTFAPELITLIAQTPGQEVGTHTYSHFYCLEKGQTPVAFKADLEKNIELAKKKGINLKSLVFPRNQYNTEYLEICYGLGLRNVRSNPGNWYWENTQKDSLSKKFFRTGDAYLGIMDKSYNFSNLKKQNGLPLSQQASRLLRPYSSNKVINNLKLKRIYSEMTYAAKRGEIYHLWWHPHNFGNNPQENLNDLTKILDHYKKCRNEFDFQTMNMDDVYNKVKNEN